MKISHLRTLLIIKTCFIRQDAYFEYPYDYLLSDDCWPKKKISRNSKSLSRSSKSFIYSYGWIFSFFYFMNNTKFSIFRFFFSLSNGTLKVLLPLKELETNFTVMFYDIWKESFAKMFPVYQENAKNCQNRVFWGSVNGGWTILEVSFLSCLIFFKS